MADLNKVILCLQKIKSKNLGQNQDNLQSFLVKGYEYRPELAEHLIDETLQANIVKSIMFNGKILYRIVKIFTQNFIQTIRYHTLLYRCLTRKLMTWKMKELMPIKPF